MKQISLISLAVLLFFALPSFSQDSTKVKHFEIYGFAQMDAGYNFNQIDPKWYDVMRPSKLPSFKNQWGTDGNVFFSVRQSRLGFKSWIPTKLGEIKTIFEFELFGTGDDAGQTTFRLRHAWGELGHFGAGQTWSPFMDPDVFPNSLEYWGPNGMVFFRNIQVRWTPILGETRLMFALERPGASADQGIYTDRIELANVESRFNLPDFSAQFHYGKKWGYVQVAGILREMKWKDLNDTARYDLSGNALGWGVNLSSNIFIGKKIIGRFQVVYGQGIENYMNDAPADVAIKNQTGNATQPIKGVALPVLGIVAFFDLNWSEKFTSTVGYSRVDISNTDGQNANEFKNGQYGLANLLYHPVKGVMAGVEVQYGDRNNYNDGWNTSAVKVQFSFKYNFSQAFPKGL